MLSMLYVGPDFSNLTLFSNEFTKMCRIFC